MLAHDISHSYCVNAYLSRLALLSSGSSRFNVSIGTNLAKRLREHKRRSAGSIYFSVVVLFYYLYIRLRHSRRNRLSKLNKKSYAE